MTSISTITTVLVAFGVTLLLGILLIPMLKKLRFGQSIRAVSYTHLGRKW